MLAKTRLKILAERIGLSRLPVGCVSVVVDVPGRKYLFLIEIEPHVRVAPYALGGASKHEFVLSWPRTLWLCAVVSVGVSSYTRASLFAIKAPYSDKKRLTPLFDMPMTNIVLGYPNLCVGPGFESHVNLLREPHDPAKRAEDIITFALNSRWTGRFHGRLGHEIVDPLDHFRKWHAQTLQDHKYYEKLVLPLHNVYPTVEILMRKAKEDAGILGDK